LFLPRIAGNLTLAPFEIIIPGGKALTGEISLRIAGPAPVPRLRFRWNSPPAFLVIGQGTELSLGLEGQIPALSPLQEYRPEPPENTILEVLPLKEADRTGGTVLRLRVIPLGGTEFVLPPARFSLEGSVQEIPGLRLPLRSAPAVPVVPPPPRETAPVQPPPPFVELRKAVQDTSPLFQEEYRRVVDQTGVLWDGGLRAEALAEIRRNERESAVGPALRPLRREMEAALGIGQGPDESWRPYKLLLLFLPADLFLICLMAGGRLLRFRFPGKKAVTLPISRGYTGIMGFLLILLALGLLVLGAGALGRRPGGEGPAVARETEVYRIPDAGSAAEAPLAEGRRVLIRAAAGSWVHVESPDGINGWVRREAIISY
jgi:hypothetical protein